MSNVISMLMVFLKIAYNTSLIAPLIHLIMNVTLKFTCKYRIVFANHYVFTEKPKMLVNIKTNRIINQVLKGGSIGYTIQSKFYSLNMLKNSIELIPKKEHVPF